MDAQRLSVLCTKGGILSFKSLIAEIARAQNTTDRRRGTAAYGRTSAQQRVFAGPLIPRTVVPLNSCLSPCLYRVIPQVSGMAQGQRRACGRYQVVSPLFLFLRQEAPAQVTLTFTDIAESYFCVWYKCGSEAEGGHVACRRACGGGVPSCWQENLGLGIFLRL